MKTNTPYRFLMFAMLLFILISTTGCGSAAPAPATAAPATAAPAVPTSVAASPTSAPTATLPPPPSATPTTPPSATPVPATATVQPSATPTLGLAQDGLSAWCIPQEVLFTAKTLTSTQAPAAALIGESKDGALEIKNLPANTCAFIYTFNQPAPAGLKLALYELKGAKPWLVTDLTPVEGSPNTVAAIVTHSYVVAPPFWNISYFIALQDASGSELRREQLNLHRWAPKICWNGLYPNVNTQRCQKPQDQHPWDPLYLTPMPTYAPGVDPEKGW